MPLHVPTLPNGPAHRGWQVFAWWPRHFRVVSPRDPPNHRSQPVLPSDLNRLRYRAGAVLLCAVKDQCPVLLGC